MTDDWDEHRDYLAEFADAVKWHVERRAMRARTRRAVEVTTRKYKARRRRRR